MLNRISINSFGYGGTNAHIVLECATQISPCNELLEVSHIDGQPRSSQVDRVVSDARDEELLFFPVSARSKTSVLAICANIKRWLAQQQRPGAFQDLSYILCNHRTIFEWRHSFVASRRSQLEDAINVILEREAEAVQDPPQLPLTIFIFTGQGSQWHAMGRELIDFSPTFKTSLVFSEGVLKRLGSTWSLTHELGKDELDPRLNSSEMAQPTTTALQIALVSLLTSVGIRPQVVLGHSSGEIAAAYAAGCISHADAMKIAFYRGLASQRCKAINTAASGMLVVGLGVEEASKHLEGIENVYVACSNSPQSTTVSGSIEGIGYLKQHLDDQSIFSRRLKVDVAYHSPYMISAADLYISFIADIEAYPAAHDVSFISSVTTKRMLSGFEHQYWVKNLLSKVRYREALREIATYYSEQRHERLSFIEIGPHGALSGPTKQTLEDLRLGKDYTYHSALQRQKRADTTIMQLLCGLFYNSHDLDLPTVSALGGIKKHSTNLIQDLPPYPWDHSRSYWFESRLSREYRLRRFPYHDLLGTQIVSSTPFEPTWRHIFSMDTLPWLRHHVIDSRIIFPGSGYLCMVIEAISQLLQTTSQHDLDPFQIHLKNVTMKKALVILQSPAKVELQLKLRSQTGGRCTTDKWQDFEIHACGPEFDWNLHCVGQVKAESLKVDKTGILAVQRYPKLSNGLSNDPKHSQKSLSANEFYEAMHDAGNVYGEQFCCNTRVELSGVRGDYHANATVQIPNVISQMPGKYLNSHIIHPTTLDALMHSAVYLYHHANKVDAVMPVRIDDVVIASNIENTFGQKFLASSVVTSKAQRIANADISVSDHSYMATNTPHITIRGLELRGLGKASHKLLQRRDIFYDMQWRLDADFLTPERLREPYTESEDSSSVTKVTCLNDFALVLATRCLLHFQIDKAQQPSGDFARLLSWMKRYVQDRTSHQRSIVDPGGIVSREHLGVEGHVLHELGPILPAIMSGETKSFPMPTKADLLCRRYRDASLARGYALASKYMNFLTFKFPRMRVLEVGAGTANATKAILGSLDTENPATLASYTFTDISVDFLDRARNILHRWHHLMRYSRLDIERDPTEQGFEQSSYDVIVASDVLCYTKKIASSLANLHKLLRPGGRLVLLEVTSTQPYLNIILGCTPEWRAGNYLHLHRFASRASS